MAKNGTEARIVSIPNCDLCRTVHPAEYDFKTKMGPWAFGCEAAWIRTRAHPDLGIGKGQKLVVVQ